MTKTIKEIRDGLSELIADIDKMQEPVSDVWPQEGDVYWFVTTGGMEQGRFYRGDSDSFRLKTGNIFRTEQDAEYHIEMINLAWEIKQHAFEPDWDDGAQSKYVCYYDNIGKKIGESCRRTAEEAQTYFPTREALNTALKDVSDKDFLYMMRKGLI